MIRGLATNNGRHSTKGEKGWRNTEAQRMAGRTCTSRCGVSASAASQLRRGQIRSSEDGHMCPACMSSTAVMVAGAGYMGGILAVCIGKFRKFFRASSLCLFQKTKEK